MGLRECHAAAACPDAPTLQFVCSEITAACDAIQARFDDPKLCAQVLEFCCDIHALPARARATTLRHELIYIAKYSYMPLRKALGPPGDWGYGTPQGQAVRWLYDAWVLLDRCVLGADQPGESNHQASAGTTGGAGLQEEHSPPRIATPEPAPPIDQTAETQTELFPAGEL